MNKLDVNDLAEGQEFTHPVYIDNDLIFIPAGVPVKQKDIDRLKAWKVRELTTEGTVKLKDEGESELESWGFEINLELGKYYNSIIKKTDELLQRIMSRVRFQEKDLEEIAMSLISKVESQSNQIIQLILTNRVQSHSGAKNAVNTSMMALGVAMDMKFPRHKMFALCCGALLHDIGMRIIPREILDQNRSLRNEELKALKTHPVYSYRIITRDLQLSEDIAQIALQHHERWDGKGYPQGLKGTNIALEARIVSVVDGFEAMVSERPWRDPLIGYEATRAILNDNQRKFDPEIVKNFIRVIGLYPVGSLVQLSDGSIGRVISISDEAPLRPEVIILINKNGKEFRGDTGPVIDLLRNRELFISRALNSRALVKKSS